MNNERRHLLVLGGSFDPVHDGHVQLAGYFAKLLFPDELRLIPAGNPWQKQPLRAAPEQRIAMLELAFGRFPVPIRIDRQELLRQGPTYTIDTLRALRAECGPEPSISFVIGADQLVRFHTWVNWMQLFDLAHFCVASRPGFGLDAAHLDAAVATEFRRRAGTPNQMRDTPHGLTYIAQNLQVDISSTQIRHALAQGTLDQGPTAPSPISGTVLDYINQHHLYRN